MKCKYCGGEVGLEEKFCSYCGRPNEQAIRHHQDMARYQDRYAETEAAVVTRTNRFAQIVRRGVLVLLLLIAAVVMYVVAENAYSIPDTVRRRAAEKQPELVISELDGYLESGDYLSFASFFEYNGLRTYGGPFEDYGSLYYCAQYYQDFVLHLEHLFLHTDHDRWLRYDVPYDINSLSRSLAALVEQFSSRFWEDTPERYLVYRDDMKENVKQMLHLYFGISEEETENFLSLSENRMGAYFEEVLLDAKAET